MPFALEVGGVGGVSHTSPISFQRFQTAYALEKE